MSLRKPTNETVISDTLGCPPEVAYTSESNGLRVSRWRQFIGSYELPPLPQPMYIAHLGGKSNIRMWDCNSWSDTGSKPCDATMFPDSLRSRWLVDGELDVVTVSSLIVGEAQTSQSGLHFAYSDPFGVALIRQALQSLYEPCTPERDAYVEALMVALRAHLGRGCAQGSADIPATISSAHRLHKVLAKIRQHPEEALSIEVLAETAGLAPSHFSRMFHRAMGVTPHQYVMRTRIDKAENLLSQSDLSVSAIADSLGFKSQAHFTRVFREKSGETPTGYRGRNRTKGQK